MPCSAGSTPCAPDAVEMNLQAVERCAGERQQRIDTLRAHGDLLNG